MAASARSVAEAVVYSVTMVCFVVFLVCLIRRGNKAGDDDLR